MGEIENNSDIKILIVDDEEDNRWITKYSLKRGLGISALEEAEDGQAGFDYLNTHDDIDIVFLDRMMPMMSGLELCQKINKTPKLQDVIVIFQTGKTAKNELEDILAVQGYYLVKKPYQEEDLILFFYPVVQRVRRRRLFKEALVSQQEVPEMSFSIRTPEEAEQLAIITARKLGGTHRAAEGTFELLMNAIEHGNLGIGGVKKNHLLKKNEYESYLAEQLAAPEHKDKSVQVLFEERSEGLAFTITDEGEGFDPSAHAVYKAENIISPVGRGITIAKSIFKQLEFNDTGNSVTCINLAEAEAKVA